MMLEGYDPPNTVAQCSECHRWFCVPCAQLLEGEAGHCKTCRGILCPEGYAAAVRERRGECFNCDAARRPEWVPERPPVPEPETHCARGHLLTGANTYEYAGVLRCYLCKRIDGREYDRKRREERKRLKAEANG